MGISESIVLHNKSSQALKLMYIYKNGTILYHLKSSVIDDHLSKSLYTSDVTESETTFSIRRLASKPSLGHTEIQGQLALMHEAGESVQFWIFEWFDDF